WPPRGPSWAQAPGSAGPPDRPMRDPMVRLRFPRPPRTGLVAAAAALVLAVFARSARAEEAIVLDNGAVLRGVVVREDATTLIFKLTGVGTDSRLPVSREPSAQRSVTVDPKA